MAKSESDLRQALAQARNIVVKVGTRILTSHGKVDHERISMLADQISSLRDQNRHVTLVSSGAIGTAMSLLNSSRPMGLSELQAFAAIGQAELIHHYNREFSRFGRFAAQVLLTADDVNHRQRYLNLRNTFFSLFELGAIPIVNENDCLATEEISVTFGDNDRLAASVAMLVDADLLVILSDVSGLFDRAPEALDAKKISFVETINSTIAQYSADTKGRAGLSKGGMSSKLRAADMAVSAGIPTVIAGGREAEVLNRIVSGEGCGTYFQAVEIPISSRKRWLKSSTDITGGVEIDPGAVKAICSKGRSLLPIGVVDVFGDFQPGEIIFVRDGEGRIIAQGISNFSHHDSKKIMRKKTRQINELMGKVVNEELIHRNNLVLL